MSLDDSATIEPTAAPAESASAKSGRSGKGRDFVTALSRGLELLRCFTREDNLLGNQELAAKTGLPKATVSRLTFTLTQLGCLRRQARSGKYMLDVGVLAFGYQMLSNLVVRTLAHPFMEELAAQTGTAVALAARDRLQMVHIDSAMPVRLSEYPSTTVIRRQVGQHLSLHASAAGRACLAATPQPERDLLLEQLRAELGDDWPGAKRALDQAFRDFADHGYCLSLGEWIPEINGIAVPLAHADHGILAFNCAGPSFETSEDQLRAEIGPRLKHMVAQVQAVAR
jgi:DNA-binding IclR family transcriptional regulator